MSLVKMRWVKPGLISLAVLLVLLAALQLTSGLTGWSPFQTTTIDRSHPAVLQELRDLSQYHAATGDYEVVVDIEKDAPWMPDFLAGERTLFVGAGTVNAYVDFGELVEEMLVMSPDGKSVEVRIPEPVLDKPNLDNERSYVFDQKRGLFNRLGAVLDTKSQQEFYLAAEKRIADAAAGSQLRQRARDNTKAMLTGLLRALGFDVTVVEAR
ncbi:hypothetical protein BBK82_21760 [Lentzea guizhouensis]|uniref:DUF4230 domain-containing protein n=1 Tax=Lentzea guizhouensis TaxID=1586287 RepID=A0A1B2HKT4_9PSEU|nr:DUF4230 domain-containing protein [Lentzea guizhouensis]ANZ38300.1 hypothetical protein BBK82_21760 [Lentzea guizhouensis]